MSVATVLPDGWLVWPGRRVRAALGARGVAALDKHEGDQATPAGLLPLRRVLYRADRLTSPPRAVVPREPISPADGWCDDPASADYNRPIRLPHPARHEVLWRDDGLYDVIGVLGWNDAPVRRGAGSAIFLHAATRDFRPTAGCVAVALPDLLALLADGVDALDVRAAE
jgi:L,D-peptidoglycan transpeptidase YkuD (ErfK/YbiS/YcfS/YnhG family)